MEPQRKTCIEEFGYSHTVDDFNLAEMFARLLRCSLAPSREDSFSCFIQSQVFLNFFLIQVLVLRLNF